MKKIQLLTITVLGLSIVSMILTSREYYLTSLIICIIAFLLAFKETGKYTGTFQFLTILLVSLVFGTTVGISQNLALALCVCLSLISVFLRLWKFSFFLYTKHLWFEPASFVISIVLYLYGNLNSLNNGWEGWLFPGLMLTFHLFIAYLTLFDAIRLIKNTKKSYGIDPGKVAPDFSLNDQDGNKVNLSDYKNKRDVLLIFVRGDWCPACHIMLRTYEHQRDIFQKKNVMIMAIGPDPVGVNRDMVLRLGIDYKLLSDETQSVFKNYSIQIPGKQAGVPYNDGMPLPASFLVDRNLIVRYSSRPDKIGEFLDPSTIFSVIESLPPLN